jgi:Family of unknown function (DUF6282)
MRFVFLVTILMLSATRALAAGTPAEAGSLAGVIDFHAHSAPDTVGRSLNSFAVVRQAKAAGLRAVVLKNHFVGTAALAQLAMQEVGGIEVFGGIALNISNGGINAEAVRRMIQVEGHRGKIVWLPTFDAENQVRFSKQDRAFVSVVKDGRPVPALKEVFELVAANDLILASGHSSAAETLVLFEAARAAGVKRLLVTHVLSDSTRASVEQMKQFAALGAVMEFTYLTHLPVPLGQGVSVVECARAIHAVGAEHFLISSDLGQANTPVHTDGLRTFMAALKTAGVTDEEIDLVARRNPARLLGLAP